MMARFSLKQLILACASAVFLLVVAGQSYADGPKTETEAGQPGSGIKQIVHHYNGTGLRNPRWVEASRVIFYDNGHKEEWRFHGDGTTVSSKKFLDKTGFVYQDCQFDKKNTLIKQLSHEKSGKTRVFLNLDGLNNSSTTNVDLKAGDELYLVYTFEPWPGNRSDSVAQKSSLVTKLAAKPADLPADAKVAEGYLASKAGNDTLVVTTTLTKAGGASRHGFPPTSRTLTYTINVKVK